MSKLGIGSDSSSENSSVELWWIIINIIEVNNYFEKRIILRIEVSHRFWWCKTTFIRFHYKSVWTSFFPVQYNGILEVQTYVYDKKYFEEMQMVGTNKKGLTKDWKVLEGNFELISILLQIIEPTVIRRIIIDFSFYVMMY